MKFCDIDRNQLPDLIKRDFLKASSTSHLKIAEIGVFEGDNAKIIYDSFPDAEINLIDIWQTEGNDFYFSLLKGETESAYQKAKEKFFGLQNVKLIKGKSEVISKNFPDEYFDYIYIDGDHTYEGCLTDLQSWFSKLKTGGVMAGHDWDCYPGHPFYHQFGVDAALKTFFKEKIHNLTLTSEVYYKSWFIQKI